MSPVQSRPCPLLLSPAESVPYAPHLARDGAAQVVRFNGIDYYLGKHGSQVSRDQYDRLVGEWMANGRQAPPRLARRQMRQTTINELILAYLHFADGYYRKNGQPTGEYDAIRRSAKPLRRLYGQLGVDDFGPLALKTVREEMIKADLCRNEVNRRVSRVVRMFKWGVENEYVARYDRCRLTHCRRLAWLSVEVRTAFPVMETSREMVPLR